jgi:hypothetical protein
MTQTIRDYALPQETTRQAIERAAREGLTLCSHTDPTAEWRAGLTVAEAQEIAGQDPGLVYVAPRYRIVTVTGRGLPAGVDADGYETRLAAEAMAGEEHDGEYRIRGPEEDEMDLSTMDLGALSALQAQIDGELARRAGESRCVRRGDERYRCPPGGALLCVRPAVGGDRNADYWYPSLEAANAALRRGWPKSEIGPSARDQEALYVDYTAAGCDSSTAWTERHVYTASV